MSTPAGFDGVFATQRLLPFTPAQVFAAFEDADRLAAWWGPAGFRNSFERFEFRAQGRWIFTMHGPDGSNYPNESEFLEVSAARIVIRHRCPPLFTLTLTLADRGSRTQLGWRQAFDDVAFADQVRHIVEPANEQNLDRLHAVLSKAPR